MNKKFVLPVVVASLLAGCSVVYSEGVKPDDSKMVRSGSGIVVELKKQPVGGKPSNEAAATPVQENKKLREVLNKYRAYQEYLDKARAQFVMIHTLEGSATPPALTPEEEAVPVIREKLEVLQNFFSSQGDKGYGDSTYWSRTYSMLAMEARIGEQLVSRLLSEHDKMNPLLRVALQNVDNNLRAGIAKYKDGYGDSDYWSGATGYIRDTMHRAAADISNVIVCLNTTPDTNPILMIKGRLAYASFICSEQGDKGYGNSTYWSRTYSMLGMQARIALDILGSTMSEHGSKMNGLLKTAILNVQNNLREAERKYSNGYGDCDYWTSATGQIRDALHRAGTDLQNILGSI